MAKDGTILHILFDGPDEFASRMMENQESQGFALKVIDFSGGNVDAHALVDEIFGAVKVISWHR